MRLSQKSIDSVLVVVQFRFLSTPILGLMFSYQAVQMDGLWPRCFTIRLILDP